MKPVHREEAGDNEEEAEVQEHLRRVVPAGGERKERQRSPWGCKESGTAERLTLTYRIVWL